MPFFRYAAYYTPPPGAFADLAASWLGWDLALGRRVLHPEVPGLPCAVAELTETPGRYGFHATLKPPFQLAPGSDAGDLEAALRVLAGGLAPARLDGLSLGEIGGFVALLPEGDTAGVDALEARLVEGLDRFRAPAPEAELARRRGDALTPAQQANLARWGYPYVMDEFRFHMTLAGPLDEPRRAAVRAALEPLFAPHCGRPVTIGEVTLAGEDAAGRFHQLIRIPLSG